MSVHGSDSSNLLLAIATGLVLVLIHCIGKPRRKRMLLSYSGAWAIDGCRPVKYGPRRLWDVYARASPAEPDRTRRGPGPLVGMVFVVSLSTLFLTLFYVFATPFKSGGI